MLLKLLLVIIGCLCSAVSFFVVRWMVDMEKKWEASQTAHENSKRTGEQLTARVEKLEEKSVEQRHCMDTVSLFSQKINRERYRINAMEDTLRAGGLIILSRNQRNNTAEETSEE